MTGTVAPRVSIALSVALVVVACGKREAAPPASWEPNRSCVSDDECRPAPSCCPAPCTSDVINRSEVEKAQRRVDAHCTNEARAACPQAGSCMEHKYACVRQQCKLVTRGSPDWPEPVVDATPPADAAKQAPKPWDLSCEKDDECVAVRAAGCCPSPCPTGVVNARDQARVEAELAESCKSQPPLPCPSAGGCRGHSISCVQRQCKVVFEGDPGYRERSP